MTLARALARALNALGPAKSFAVVAAALVGLVVRLTSIRSSLWLDEFSTLWAVESGFRAMASRLPGVMGQSPLYYVLAWASIHVLGESEWALRLPSLLAGGLAAVLIGWAAAVWGGRRAGLWSGALFWLCYPAVWESVNARPYELAMCGAAIATLGFVRACRTGAWRDRAIWIAGAVAVVWAHYLFVPFLVGFPVAFLLRPALRQRYEGRKLITDCAVVTLVVSPSLFQVAHLIRNPGSQEWLFSPHYLGVFGLLAPFALAALMPAKRKEKEVDHSRDLAYLLWTTVGLQFIALIAGRLVGLDLIAPRYASVIVVPLSVLAGTNLARLRGADLLAPLAAYSMVTGLTWFANLQVCGSFSGAGCQQWREAVAALRPELESPGDAVVLYRSGNAEDDMATTGQLTWPATLAPLRSPGEPAPQWPVVLLTYAWNTPQRLAYFEDTLRGRLRNRHVFFMLCLTSTEPGTDGYCRDTAKWIATTWPGRFRAQPLGDFRQLLVLRFDRVGD